MVGLLERKIAVYIQIVSLARPSLTSETSIMSQRTSVTQSLSGAPLLERR